MALRRLFVLSKQQFPGFSLVARTLAISDHPPSLDLKSELSSRTPSRQRATNEPVRDFAIPLTTGKQFKQTRMLVPPSVRKTEADSELLQVSAFGISQSIDINRMPETSFTDYNYHRVKLPNDIANEIFHITKPCTKEMKLQSDIFIFKSGVVVFWNVPDSESHKIMTSIRKECHAPVALNLVESEELFYSFTPKPTFLDGEDIRLQNFPAPHDDTVTNSHFSDPLYSLIFEKIAFSDALALSVKLSLLETSFDSVAVQMEPWIEKMQTGLGIFFKQSVVFRKTGELFTLRHLLNISTNITETPDFYWDRPEVERLFTNLKAALSVQSRTRILNSKLDTCCELTEILTNHLQQRHSARLEWMIIILILVEVIFECHRQFGKSFGAQKDESLDSKATDPALQQGSEPLA